MQISINLTDGTGPWGAGDGRFDDGASIEDCGEIVLHLGQCDVHMSYNQFERFLDNVLRWRWSVLPEGEAGGCDLNAETPPPSWEEHVRAQIEEVESERYSIAADLSKAAEQHGLLPQPEKGDKLALRWFLNGRSHGVKAGLEEGAKLVRERAQRLTLTPRTKEGM